MTASRIPRRPERFFIGLRARRERAARSPRRAAAVVTSNELFNELLCRSLADLGMLVTETAHGPYPYAGMPWFSTAFGRDGIITALQTAVGRARSSRGRAALPGRTQATEVDPARDAEPGKILHEMRARRDGAPGRGAVRPLLRQRRRDAAVRDAGRRCIASAPATSRRSRELWPNIEARARLDRRATATATATASSSTRARPTTGSCNQGWKDSHDSIFHADGRLAEAPIALCEVQGYVYARQAGRRAGGALGDARGGAPQLAQQAAALRERFEAAFWCEELGTYALALDGEKRPCRVRASNAGHVLFTGIALPERAARVAERCSCRRLLLRLGHPHRGGAARRATIRCRITTARSGRTTTR